MDNCVKESKPEFLELLESMKDQLDMLEENSSIIFQKVNTIKDITEPEEEEMLKGISQVGVLDDLWECVSRLRRYNESLNRSKKGLIRFIG
jgi:dsDNA-specific endonuclease/ATPase MutS2